MYPTHFINGYIGITDICFKKELSDSLMVIDLRPAAPQAGSHTIGLWLLHKNNTNNN